jgi:predicted Rossmann fold nucleotide-binding protein DprA/Smf involved in DNA uptake
VTEAQDVLDLLFEAGSRSAALDERPALTAELWDLLRVIEDGHDTTSALAGHGSNLEETMARLATLELAGYVHRGPGGRFTVIP